jgi:hypothetical protein
MALHCPIWRPWRLTLFTRKMNVEMFAPSRVGELSRRRNHRQDPPPSLSKVWRLRKIDLKVSPGLACAAAAADPSPACGGPAPLDVPQADLACTRLLVGFENAELIQCLHRSPSGRISCFEGACAFMWPWVNGIGYAMKSNGNGYTTLNMNVFNPSCQRGRI